MKRDDDGEVENVHVVLHCHLQNEVGNNSTSDLMRLHIVLMDRSLGEIDI